MNSMVCRLVVVAWLAIIPHLFPSPGHAEPLPEDLVLSAQGGTEYVIVPPELASVVDEYSLNVLSAGLKAKTGIDFPVISSRELSNQQRKRIYVGISSDVIEDLGRDPSSDMADQEIAVQSVGENVYIYEKGLHGNLYAVVDFLDHTLDRRWCVDEHYERPSYNRVETLVIKPFARSRRAWMGLAQGSRILQEQSRVLRDEYERKQSPRAALLFKFRTSCRIDEKHPQTHQSYSKRKGRQPTDHDCARPGGSSDG